MVWSHVVLLSQPKCTKSSADVARKRLCCMIDLERKWYVIKDYDVEIEWWLLLLARHIPFYHSYHLEAPEQNDRTCSSVCFVEGNEANKNSRSAYIWYGEKLLITCITDQTPRHILLSTLRIMARRKCLWCWKKSPDLTTVMNLLLALHGLNSSRIVIHYVMWKANGECVSADVKAAEGFLEILHMLIVEENYLPA